MRIRPAVPADAPKVVGVYVESSNDSIGVDPAHWRTGVGRALMAVALDDLAKYGEAILWTIAGYERAIAFYQAVGWVADGRGRDEGRQVSFRWSAQRVGGQGQ